jgi:ketosteroid isomerase-like protein
MPRRPHSASSTIDASGKEADLRRKQEELDAARTAAQQSYVEARKKATAAVVAAREAYRKAGGTD